MRRGADSLLDNYRNKRDRGTRAKNSKEGESREKKGSKSPGEKTTPLRTKKLGNRATLLGVGTEKRLVL